MKRVAASDPAAPARFWQTIQANGLVVYPTDTLYGFGVDGLHLPAIERLMAVKGRTGPFSVMVGGPGQLREYALVSSQINDKLVQMLPGPYTIVLTPRKPEAFPEPVISPVGMVGFRVPRHPFIQAAFQQARGLVISTSVNRSGQPPLQDPEAIIDSFGPDIDLLIDGGLLPGSRGSTVVNPAVQPWQIIRQGDGKL